MDKTKINKAAQLADDLKKIQKAIGLFGESNKIAVRISASVDEGAETMFAYLPKSILPVIYTALTEHERGIIKEMEDL